MTGFEVGDEVDVIAKLLCHGISQFTQGIPALKSEPYEVGRGINVFPRLDFDDVQARVSFLHHERDGVIARRLDHRPNSPGEMSQDAQSAHEYEDST